jgi:hypothetical protein
MVVYCTVRPQRPPGDATATDYPAARRRMYAAREGHWCVKQLSSAALRHNEDSIVTYS